MHNLEKKSKIFAITLLSALMLLSVASVSAQGMASVTVLDVIGGTTDPTGTNSYNAGTSVQLTASPLAGYEFLSWQIVTASGTVVASDNPHTLTVVADETYAVQPVFEVIQSPGPGDVPPTDFSTAAIVAVLASSGGTTNPSPGVYALQDASQFDLTAVPDNGWQFSHWVITGDITVLDALHGDNWNPTPTDNPYTVANGLNCGYGSRFNYQPVFTPIGSTEPTPSGQTPTPAPGPMGGITTETGIIIALVVVIIIMLIAFGVFAMRKNK